MDTLVGSAGFVKLETLMDRNGIFRVSLVQRRSGGNRKEVSKD
jgi:hypothetical protein